MKIYFLTFINCFLLVATISCSFSKPITETQIVEVDKSALSLTLWLNKQVYKRNEAIDAILFLSNQGKNDLIINSRMAINNSISSEIVRDISIFIEKPSGINSEFKVKVTIVPVNEEFFIPLHPGFSIHKKYILNEYYSLDELGVYSVFAVYENQFDSNNHYPTWKGRIESNEVQFEIK